MLNRKNVHNFESKYKCKRIKNIVDVSKIFTHCTKGDNNQQINMFRYAT